MFYDCFMHFEFSGIFQLSPKHQQPGRHSQPPGVAMAVAMLRPSRLGGEKVHAAVGFKTVHVVLDRIFMLFTPI